MKFHKTSLPDVYEIELEPRGDERGYFSRVFCKNELKEIGITFNIAQINRSLTEKKGTIRGLHMQKSPMGEDKIVQCLQGEIFDVAVDMRKNSKTYGKWYGTILNPENKKMLLVPKGFAHGFQVLKKGSLVEYFVSQFYTPDKEIGFRWNDPYFKIQWPIKKAVLSEKDNVWPLLKK